MSIQALEIKLQKLEKKAKKFENDHKRLMLVRKDYEDSIKLHTG